MRVKEDARKCSIFIGHASPTKRNPDGFAVSGTGFLVNLDVENEGGFWAYLVTAAHVARRIGTDPFCLRLNRLPEHGGGSVLYPIDNANWLYHKQREIDVAALLVDLPDWVDHTVMFASEFLNDARTEHFQIGPGDAAYIVGLFALHAGTKRNLPVVYSGSIALMPSDEKIPVARDDGSGVDEIEAYLVEAHAIPGASGSQVVVRPTIQFLTEDQEAKLDSLALAEGRDYLLGIWVANWPGTVSQPLATAMGLRRGVQVPIGMGLVIPAQRILEVLVSKEAEAERKPLREQQLLDRAAQPNAAPARSGPPTTADNPRHKEAFNSLVDAAAKKRPQDG